MLLEHKVAVVYGGGGSIGGAVARSLAREGAQVFLAGRRRGPVEAVAEEISSAGGFAQAAEVDATDEVAVDAHVSAVAADAGRIDIAFNAIGMGDIQGPTLLEMPVRDFERPVTTATRTQFVTARRLGQQMADQRSGALLTVVAPVSRHATPNVGGFGTACSAVEGLWRTLAAELGPYGVRVVCLRSAGSPDTPDLREMLRAHAETRGVDVAEMEAEFGSGALLGRLPRVAEVAEVATMMASDRASALTGTFVNVTCGSPVD